MRCFRLRLFGVVSLLSVCLSANVVVRASGPWAQDPVAPPTPPPPPVMRDPVRQPVNLESLVITRIEPEYPVIAQAAGAAGAVSVQVSINSEGNVVSARGAGHALLINAATSAVRRWKFKPLEEGQAGRVRSGTIAIRFSADTVAASSSGDEDDLQAAQRWAQAYPTSAEVFYWLGSIYNDDDKYAEAAQAFSQSIKLKPDHIEAYLDLAEGYKELKQFDEEIKTYKQGVDANPDSVELAQSLAQALETRKRYTEAADAFKHLTELNPDDADAFNSLGWHYMQTRRLREAEAALAQAIKLRPGFAVALHNLGATYLRLEKYNEAIDAYQQLLRLPKGYPKMEGVYRELGVALVRTGRASEGIESLKRALEVNPANPEAQTYCYLGIAYGQMTENEEALAAFKKGIGIKSDDYCSRSNLGVLLGRQGKLAEAEESLRIAVQVSPDAVEARVNLASALFAQHKVGEAEAEYARVVEMDPNNARWRVIYGAALAQDNKRMEAEIQYREALRIEPDNPGALNDLGYSMVERGEKVELALAMIQRAVDSQPNNSSFLDSLAWAYFKLGKLQEAEKYGAQAAKDSKSPVVVEHLADIYDRLGKKDLAAATWQKALALALQPEQKSRLKTKLGLQSQK